MLALRPHPAPTHATDMFHCRGRSRQVSNTALARQASEERRVSCAVAVEAIHRRLFVAERNQVPQQLAPLVESSVKPQTMIPIASPMPVKAAYAPPFMRSASPSPPSSASMSPDYYDSPPSPPRSLEDQVHVAYALDDIHLAKILLLRLKGIEVTSDDDPRIAAVQDEDFDFCFVPNGKLMDDRDEKAIEEMQARELERIEELKRVERLRNCERKWEAEKARMREERAAVLRRRERKRAEDEEQRRRADEQERRQVAEDERRRRAGRKARPDRKIVSYDHLASQSNTGSDSTQQFVYSFMVPGPCSSPRPHNPPTPPVYTRHSFPAPTFDDSTSIPFTDVLRSMQGQLFPITHEERAQRGSSTSRSRTHSRQKGKDVQLLEALLVQIEYHDEERRKRKGKQRAQLRPSPGCLACSAISSPLPSPSSTSSSISRTPSWLSFRTGTPSSASSSTTDLTTLSSSPKSAWFSSRPKSWIPGSTMSESPTPMPRHSCRPHNRLATIPLSDGPLVIDTPSTAKSAPLSYQGRARSTSTARAAKEGAGVLVRRMSKFVELAKGFQNAYVTAALFSVSVSYDSFDDRPFVPRTLSADDAPSRSSSRAKLRPAGCRASATDVASFLNPTALVVGAGGDSVHLSKYIPLTSPFPTAEPPRTVLSGPLPYKLHFKPIPAPSRSPFRFHALSELHTMYPTPPVSRPPGQLSWRIRSVGNPAYLRLKALHNVVWRRGCKWEGCGRETALGGGRERVVGVAYEGVGSSLLSRSVTLTPPCPCSTS